MRVFVDTNVLLDTLLARPPWGLAAQQVWALAEGRVDACIAALSHANVYYVARRHAGTPGARSAVQEVRRVFATVPCDNTIIDQALAATDLPDFEDAIQYFSAIAANADCIVTRDAAGFPRATPPAMTPPQFLSRYSFDR